MSNELWQANNPTPFILRIKEKFGFSIQDQVYCTSDTIKKVKEMGLPIKECSINDVFIGSNEPLNTRREYCVKNCGFKCIST